MAYLPSIKQTFTSNGTFVVPKKHYIKSIMFVETAGNVVTGGVKIGTTNGGVDVVVALAVGANSIQAVLDATLLKRIFSMSADTTLYVQAVAAWASASVDIYFELGDLS